MALVFLQIKEKVLPKTHNGLWPSITSWENLLAAYRAARKGKRYSADALRFRDLLEENLINIQNHLQWQTWTPAPWREFWIYDPKSRLIQAPRFKDRVVHHALADVLEPFFDRKMIYHSYACRKGKGTHAATSRVQHDLRIAKRNWGDVYVLQADISKYFPSIDHDVLLRLIARTIRDPDVLWLCRQIIKNTGFKKRGIPVGALTSQLFANIYLTALDHKVQSQYGRRHYVRYMDDFIILGKSKAELQGLLYRLREFLATNLRLALNPKTSIYPARSRMVDFAGYRICATHMLPRKRNIKRTRSCFKKLSRDYAQGRIGLADIQPKVASFLGYAKHCSSRKTTDSVLAQLKLQRPAAVSRPAAAPYQNTAKETF
jgi:RNA-directed DNA polymerase